MQSPTDPRRGTLGRDRRHVAHSVLPHLTDPYARNVTTKMIGLATYAGRRGSDPSAETTGRIGRGARGAAGQDVLRSCSPCSPIRTTALTNLPRDPRTSPRRGPRDRGCNAEEPWSGARWMNQTRRVPQLAEGSRRRSPLGASPRALAGQVRRRHVDRSLARPLERGGVFGTSSDAEFTLMQSFMKRVFPWTTCAGSNQRERCWVSRFSSWTISNGPGDRGAVERPPASLSALARVHELSRRSICRRSTRADDTHPDRALAQRRQVVRCSAGAPARCCGDVAASARAASQRVTLVHGDAGPGNVLSADGKWLMTDWEFAHVGDPAEDWSSCVSIRGSRTMSRTWRACSNARPESR